MQTTGTEAGLGTRGMLGRGGGAAPPRLRERVARLQGDRLDGAGRWLQGRLQTVWHTPAGRRAKDLLNGTWLGHPLHPAVTDVPIGAWTTASVFDLLTATRRARLDGGATAAVALGIAGAVASAVTGLADWSDTGGRQRRTGLLHAGLNTVALGFQVASLVSRLRGRSGGRALSTVGLGIASFSAWLGGELVYREGTQVDRNAWNKGVREFTRAMALSELPADRPTRAEVDGKAVMLVRSGGQIFALEDRCSHAGCSLARGKLEGGAVICPCHGSTFRLADGAVLHGPSPYDQPRYEVRVDNGEVFVRRS